MDFLRNNKTTLGAVLAGILLIVGYYLFWSGGSTPTLLSSSAAPSTESQQLLATLGDLHTVTLDNAVFKNALFMSLMDFGTVIPAQPVGRHNPFAPAGSSAAKPSVPAGTRR